MFCINEWRCYEDITHTISHLLIEVLEQEVMSSEFANLIRSFEAAGRAQSVDISFVYKLIVKIILHIILLLLSVL